MKIEVYPCSDTPFLAQNPVSLNLPAELEAGFFNGLPERTFIDIVYVVPFHAKFLLRNIGRGKFHAVQHANRLLDTRLAVAAAHAVHAVSHENAFIAFLFVVVTAVSFVIVSAPAMSTMFVPTMFVLHRLFRQS